MTYPTIFNNLTGLNNSAGLFDTMFNICGQQGNIPCTASGTNALTLTPGTNYYVPAAYTDGQLCSFKAVANSSGVMTVQITGLALVKLFVPAGTQANSGSVVLNTNYLIQYWSNLDTGNGGFIIVNSSVPAIASPLQGSFKNLKITPGGSTTQVTVTADAVVVANNSGGTVTLTSYAPPVINILNVGVANGLDPGAPGAVASATWYAVYAIYNSTTQTAAGLLSISGTAPVLPSGYTYSARLGWVRTQTGGTSLLNTLQNGRRAQYVVAGGGLPAIPPKIADSTGGAVGTYSLTSPVYAAASVANFVPTTATSIFLGANNSINGTGPNSLDVVPNSGWGGTNNGMSGSNSSTTPLHLNVGFTQSLSMWMELESTNVYWATSGTTCGIYAIGWEDNI